MLFSEQSFIVRSSISFWIKIKKHSRATGDDMVYHDSQDSASLRVSEI